MTVCDRGYGPKDILRRVLKMYHVKMTDINIQDIKLQDMKLLHILVVLLCYISDRMFSISLLSRIAIATFFKLLCFTRFARMITQCAVSSSIFMTGLHRGCGLHVIIILSIRLD